MAAAAGSPPWLRVEKLVALGDLRAPRTLGDPGSTAVVEVVIGVGAAVGATADPREQAAFGGWSATALRFGPDTPPASEGGGGPCAGLASAIQAKDADLNRVKSMKKTIPPTPLPPESNPRPSLTRTVGRRAGPGGPLQMPPFGGVLGAPLDP
ncbi:hypothetical protein cyc_01238 [Cyclospora cayetanensis]|nr:hypothetical protein cyc_01238 [Cyclospora cayetanensis]